MDSHPQSEQRSLSLAEIIAAEASEHNDEQREEYEELAAKIEAASEISEFTAPVSTAAAALPNAKPEPAQSEHDQSELPPFLPLPDSSPALQWRMARLYKDILGLSRNELGACFKKMPTFARDYKCDVATVRRWLSELIRCGWVRPVGNGRARRLQPLVSAQKVVSFFARFARLFRAFLRGFKAPIPIPPDREVHSNTTQAGERRQPAAPEPPPLSSEDEAVVVAASSAGVTEEIARKLVRQIGRLHLKDAVDAVLWRIRKGRKVGDSGALIHTFALRLAAGDWPLPPGLIEERNAQERAAERSAVLAQRAVKRAAGAKEPPVASAEEKTPAALAYDAQQAELDRIELEEPERWGDLWATGEGRLSPPLRGRTKLTGYRTWVRIEIARILCLGSLEGEPAT